jgi:hypothetical protein
LPFSARFGHYFKSYLMTELMLRYMNREQVEQAITGLSQKLSQKQFAAEPVMSEF